MKRLLLVICLVSLVSGGYAQTEESDAPKFPQWAKDLRRAEIVAFGSFPLTMLFAGIAVDSYRLFSHDMDSKYAPIFGSAQKSKGEQIAMITSAVAGSLIVALADFIVVRYKRHKIQSASKLPEGTPIIIRSNSRSP
ncbi:MAG: hypothetical protein LBG87_08575 [Spirochaetaceae bacterium]|jgi:hypothetical protein|nr:hypothetical protein [Spirochaetaceae bacterium]